MIMIWKQEKLPIEKLLSLLFTSGRLSHACCYLPLDERFLSIAKEHLGVCCHDIEFWINCFKGDHPSLCMFLQRTLPSALFIPQSCKHPFGRQFSFVTSVDEVSKVASSLVSGVSSVGCITSKLLTMISYSLSIIVLYFAGYFKWAIYLSSWMFILWLVRKSFFTRTTFPGNRSLSSI